MMDKFTLEKSHGADGYKPIIIDANTYDKLVQIKALTGVAMTRIMAQMVDFCSERLQVTED